MPQLASLMLFGWVPLTVLLFYTLPARKAVFISIVFGYLFLPNASVNVPGMPNYTKAFACLYGVFLGALIFDSQRLFSIRLNWIDIPAILFCLAPGASSLVNASYDPEFTQGGWYDATSASVAAALTWGLPYYLGRIYLTSLEAVKEFSMWVFIGGLVYVPFCLIELRFSPQLHRWIYGFHSSSMMHSIRFGGYRPTVFMQTGLALGLYMVAATLCGLWLYLTKAQRKLWGYDMFWLVAILGVVTLLCKAVGAILLLMMALGALYTTRWFRTALPLIALTLLAPSYALLRGTQTWDARIAVDAANMISESRGRSLEFRLDNEDILIDKADDNPWFGWARWGRSRVFDKNGKDISVTDGLWIIVLGETGIVGLATLCAAFALPPLVLLYKFGWRIVDVPGLSPVVVWLVMCGVYAIDNLMNAMHNPVFLLGLGGTAAMCTLKMRLAPKSAKATPAKAAAATRGRTPATPVPAAPARVGGRPAALRSPGTL